MHCSSLSPPSREALCCRISWQGVNAHNAGASGPEEARGGDAACELYGFRGSRTHYRLLPDVGCRDARRSLPKLLLVLGICEFSAMFITIPKAMRPLSATSTSVQTARDALQLCSVK